MSRGRGGRNTQWRDLLRDEKASGSGVNRASREGKFKDLDFEFDDEELEDQSKEFTNEFAAEELLPKQIEELLYFHPSDHPGMALVSAPLTTLNFMNWSRSIRRALGAKRKLEFLDGTLPEPDPSEGYYKQWITADCMISSWIINSISKELVNAFSHIDGTRKLWIALNKRFGGSNGPKIYKLQREIYAYSQGNQTVVQYFNNLSALWDELDMLLPPLNCTCKARKKADRREEQQKMLKFLHGLNSMFERARSQILLLDPLPDVDRAYSMIIQVEDEMSLNNDMHDGHNMMTLNVGEGSSQNQVFAVGGGKGNVYKRRLTKEEKKRLKCRHCHETGHEMDECFKLHGVPDWYKKYKENRDRYQANFADHMEDTASSYSGYEPRTASMDISRIVQSEITKYLSGLGNQNGVFPLGNQNIGFTQGNQNGGYLLGNGSQNAGPAGKNDVNMVYKGKVDEEFFDGHYAFSIIPSMERDRWIVDSGASIHICVNPELLTSITQLDVPIKIHLPNGDSRIVSYAGTAQINKNLFLHDVLFVPEFTHNLVSVARLIKEAGVQCLFYTTHCVFQKEKTGAVLGIGKMKGNLYVLESLIERQYCHLLRPSEMSILDWHVFLGHPSASTMQHLKIITNNFSKDDLQLIRDCDVCLRAKQTRNPFPQLNRRTSTLFELVHGDVWGPYGEESVCNTKYVLTLVEDHSRTIWTYLLQSKEQVAGVLHAYIKMVENHFEKRIKIFRSDNGSEFINKKVAGLFGDSGILHQKSCVYTPQQNGIVERRHRTLLESARALMFHSQLPLKFWPYAILTATWLLNRTPTRVLQWKTPYSLLFKSEPDYTTLQPFGCLAYAVNLTPQRSKFHSRNFKCVFIGYSANHKGYLLYDLENAKVLTSRDVHFVPKVFPYASGFSPVVPDLVLPLVNPNTPYGPVEAETNDMESVASPSADTPLTPAEAESLQPTTMRDVEPPLGDAASPIVLRRSTRVTHPPVWMKDFVSNVNLGPFTFGEGTALSTFPYSISPALTQSYVEYLFNLAMITEPQSYKEACTKPEWIEAMNQELAALETNNTWELTELPAGKKPIGCKWVYKVKLKADGQLEKCKARLVAKGFNQQYGLDYTEVFSPVAKHVTVRLLITLATVNAWPLHQLDVNNAFLHGFLRDEIYMTPPPGYTRAQPGQVCHLIRSLYGLKQASREWNMEFCRQLFQQGFVQSPNDHCLFTRGTGADFICLLVYVDDVLVTSPSQHLIDDLKAFLHSVFTIKDLGVARYFLGIEIARSEAGTVLCQRKYVLDLLHHAGLLGCKPVATPFPAGLVLSQGTAAPLADPDTYRRLVGQLLYLNLTRPDISYAAQQLSQYVARPTTLHWDAAVHVLKYLKGSPSTGIFISSHSNLQLTGYSDADWGACRDTRRSLSGYCIFLGSTLVSWKCKKQHTVSASSAEAEYRSLSTTTKELMWLVALLREFGVSCALPIMLHCDNHAAIHITKNQVFHERTKHLDIDCHLVREKYRSGFLVPSAISTVDQLADLFTKSLPGPRFRFLLSKMALFDLHSAHLEGG